MGFLIENIPTLTAMLKSRTVNDILKEIEEIHSRGAHAFGFQIDMLNPDQIGRISLQ